MTKDEREAIDQMANALQAAAPLATTLRRELAQQAEMSLALEAAIDRAARALRRMRPENGGGK